MENAFAERVAERRDKRGEGARAQKTQAFIDFAWSVWAGHFDQELEDLAAQELHGRASGFLWHNHLAESNTEMGGKYRAFVAARTAGPIICRLCRELGLRHGGVGARGRG